MNPQTDDVFAVTVVTTPDDPCTLVVLAGEIDLPASTALTEVAGRLAATATTVAIDLAQITFAGATLLTFVADLHRRLPAGSSLSLCRPGSATRRLLLIAGMDQIATLHSDVPTSGPISACGRRALITVGRNSPIRGERRCTTTDD